MSERWVELPVGVPIHLRFHDDGVAWTVDPHDTSDNTLAVEDAADHLAHKLGES